MPIFNVARGKLAYYATLPAANDAFVAVLFQAASQVPDGTMRDYTTLAAIKAANTEATFTNYTRRVFTNLYSPGLSIITPDLTTDTLSIDTDDLVWSAAGGTTNNSLGRLILTYNPDTTASGNDSSQVPLLFYDFVTTTDGTTKKAQINAAGLWKSA